MAFTAASLCQQYQTALLAAAKSKPERELSQVFCTDHSYEVRLDIQNFHPDEISVKALDRFILVEGKHEERGERLGLISHSFSRRYVLPDGVLAENVTCSLGSDGILLLEAPRNLQEAKVKEVHIPIKKPTESPEGVQIQDVTSPKEERVAERGK